MSVKDFVWAEAIQNVWSAIRFSISIPYQEEHYVPVGVSLVSAVCL